MVAILCSFVSAFVAAFFTASRAETLGEVALRQCVWLVLHTAAAIIVAITSQLPPGHPAD
jgi:hypothetical protein